MVRFADYVMSEVEYEKMVARAHVAWEAEEDQWLWEDEAEFIEAFLLHEMYPDD